MHEAVRRLRPDQPIEAAGYIRVSDERQTLGHSPEVQRDAIKRLAAQEGFALTLVEQDVQKGRVVSRHGYQRIVEAVRAGSVHAVLVFMFDRFGRDGAEWLTRAHEFERLGVPIISVQEGHDEGGIMRFVRAGMAEEYSRQLAKRVRPNKEKGARQGTHMGPTPIGYRREYPPITDARHRPAGLLVPDEQYAWVVRELFARYAAGGWSQRRLADWLNADPRVPPPPALPAPSADKPTRRSRDEWLHSMITSILGNPIYCGIVRYNRRPMGYYDRAPAGSEFSVDGKHEALISRDLFDQVKVRRAAASLRPSSNYHINNLEVGSGLFACECCGGPMTISHYCTDASLYRCSWRQTRKGSVVNPCTGVGYAAHRAHDALLREMRRLRGAPWTPQAMERLGGQTAQDAVRAVQQALEDARNQLRRHTRLMSLMEDDPTPEQIVTFREISGELSGRIRALEAELAGMDTRAARVPALRLLHERLSQTELRGLVDDLIALEDKAGLRDLLMGLVKEVRIIERVPEAHPQWLRAEVIWNDDVGLLLQAELLTLDAPEPSPVARPARPGHREYMRAYYQRKLAADRAAREDR